MTLASMEGNKKLILNLNCANRPVTADSEKKKNYSRIVRQDYTLLMCADGHESRVCVPFHETFALRTLHFYIFNQKGR